MEHTASNLNDETLMMSINGKFLKKLLYMIKLNTTPLIIKCPLEVKPIEHHETVLQGINIKDIRKDSMRNVSF